jgi:hypothetical protein
MLASLPSHNNHTGATSGRKLKSKKAIFPTMPYLYTGVKEGNRNTLT